MFDECTDKDHRKDKSHFGAAKCFARICLTTLYQIISSLNE